MRKLFLAGVIALVTLPAVAQQDRVATPGEIRGTLQSGYSSLAKTCRTLIDRRALYQQRAEKLAAEHPEIAEQIPLLGEMPASCAAMVPP